MATNSLAVNITIVLFAACIHAMLQLGLGCVVLLYQHGQTRQKVPRRTNMVVSSFISGVGVVSLLVLATLAFILANTFDVYRAAEFYLAIAAAIAVLALLVWSVYYRRRRSTELWLPRPIARFIDERAAVTKNTSEGFLLGVLATFGEILFLLPLMLAAAGALLTLPVGWELVALAGYVVIAVLPLILTRCGCAWRRATIGDIQTFRHRHQRFIKAISGIMYLILALFILVFKVWGA